MLTILAVFGSGLLLFVALSACALALTFLDSRRYRKMAEERMQQRREKLARLETWRNYYGLTWPKTRGR